MSRKKPKYYHNELYEVDFYFFVNWNKSKFNKHVKTKYDLEFEENAVGRTIHLTRDNGPSIFLVWSNEGDKTNYVLVHECVHAAIMTLNIVGIDPRNDNGEALAYLTDCLFKKAIEK